MRRFSAEQKEAAAESQDRANLATIASGPVVAAIALVPVAGPFLAVAGAAVTAALGMRAYSQSRIVRDPPDPNFHRPVRVVERHLDLSRLGEDPFQTRAAAFAQVNEEVGSTCRAMVGSLERAMGAEEAGELGYADSRLREAGEHAAGLVQRLELAAELNAPLREALSELEVEPLIWEEPLRLGDLLPAEALAELYHAGIPRRLVFDSRSSVPVVERGGSLADPVGTFVEMLWQLENGDRVYAEATARQLEEGGFIVEEEEEMPGGGAPLTA
jgi:hypothetical protein